MKNFLLAGVVLVAVASGPALSADLPPRQAPPPIAPVVVAPVFSWTGCYIGANVGWARARVKVDWVANPVGYGTLGLVNAAALGSLSSNSVIGGGEVGCNLQTGFVVWGVEGDFQGTSLKQTRTLIVPNGVFTNEQEFKIGWLSTVRGRVGVTATPNTLLYVTGGAAFAQVQYRDCEVHGVSPPTCDITAGPYNLVTVDKSRVGFAAGAGAEFAFGRNWSAKIEYLYVGLGSVTTVSQRIPFLADHDITHNHRNLSVQMARFGINYRFGGGY